MARRTLTDAGVRALKPRATRYAFPDPELRGHYVRIAPSGQKSFVTVAVAPNSKQVWTTLGACDVLSIEAAREQARDVIRRVRAGLPAVEPTPDTFGDVAMNWLRRHVEARQLRSRKEIERILNRYVLPRWRDREFASLRRSDIAALLDRVQDEHGPRQADYVLATIRSIANWFASRHDDYHSPFTRGMRRASATERARARILDDAEIQAIWKAAESNGTFGAFVRLALLTAQRREKIAAMRWHDISIDGEWTIPTAEREKGTPGSLLLPEMALAVIKGQPRIGDNPFVLAGRGKNAFNGYSKAKRAFDAKLPPMPSWVIHDVRRTARSLMSRAGVRPDIAERVLGHAIPGVEGVYDRHSYREEKADALRKLAGLIATIIDPRDNVLPMQRIGK